MDGVVAHPEKTKYMIIGIRQKLFHCEKCALTLFLDDRELEQAQEERLLGLDRAMRKNTVLTAIVHPIEIKI